jgi:hypothetical protein
MYLYEHTPSEQIDLNNNPEIIELPFSQNIIKLYYYYEEKIANTQTLPNLRLKILNGQTKYSVEFNPMNSDY